MNRTISTRLARPLTDSLTLVSLWVQGSFDYAAAVRYFILALAVVLASAILVGAVAVRSLASANEASLQARLRQGESALSSYSTQRLVELEGLAEWLARNPATLDQAFANQAVSPSEVVNLLGLGGADFIAVQGRSGEIQVAPADLHTLVEPFASDPPPISRGGSSPADIVRSADGNLLGLAQVPAGEANVLAGFYLNRAFADQFAARSGLDLTLFVGGTVVGTNLSEPNQRFQAGADGARFESIQAEREGISLPGSFSVGGRGFLAQYFPLSDRSGHALGAYAVALPAPMPWDGFHIGDTTYFLLLALMSLALVSGGVLAKRIVIPLRSLRLAVSRIGRGDLATPVVARTSAEVEPLAEEIEEMRQSLLHAHRQLTIEKSLYQGTFHAMADGVFTTDASGTMTSVNPALLETLQTDIWHSAMCCGSAALRDPEGRSLCDVACTWLWLHGQAEPVVVKGYLEPFSGPARDIEMTVTPIKDAANQTVGLVHVVRDVSHQEQLQRLKERFLMSVSHELRTPLSALSTSVEFLNDEFHSLASEDRDRLLETVRRSSGRLQTLTVNLLDLGSIQAGTFSVKAEPLSLNEPLQEALGLCDLALAAKGQQVEVRAPPDPPWVLADSVRVVQVLVNLIGNASKYGPADDTIVVTIDAGDEKVRTAVTDHGIAIPAEEKQQIFDYFFRGSDATRTETGLGIGLAIARGIIEAHRGEIGVTSEPGEGTTFWFTLPNAS